MLWSCWAFCVLSVSDWRLSHTINCSAAFQPIIAVHQTAELHFVDQRGLRGLMHIKGGVICKKVYPDSEFAAVQATVQSHTETGGISFIMSVVAMF